MNTPILAVGLETDAVRAILRACATSPRPMHHTETGANGWFGGATMTIKPPAPPPLPDELLSRHNGYRSLQDACKHRRMLCDEWDRPGVGTSASALPRLR